MNADDAISVSSGDEGYTYNARRSILEPAIRSVVEALGGLERGVYRLGDECYGCLKDLKKYWRKDDTDDERTVARIFWEARVLPNDLIPILLATARGNFEDKRAIACADLITAMTWPIDLAEELQELDEVEDKGTDYTQLLSSHLAYKAALLKPEVMQALFGIVLACLAKTTKEKTDRDVQVVHVVLYLLRNLAFIKDLPANMHLSADQAEYSSLQTRYIKILRDTQIFEFLLTAASSSVIEPMFNTCNTLVLDIFYLLFRGIKPTILAVNQVKQPAQNLQRLLAAESQRKQSYTRNASSRHSRFGTTISVSLNPKKLAQPKPDDEPASEEPTATQKLVLHRQQAISRDAGTLLDMTSSKRTKAQKMKKVDELGREDNLSLEAKLTLQDVAKKFIESCFNPLLESLLKDIRAERPKITEKDNLRLLYVTKWFLEFFQCQRSQEPNEPLAYGFIAEVTDRSWIVWVLKRMREAVEEKPKLWTELQAGIDCLTQLVLLIDAMSTSDEAEMADAAQTLQHQIIYNGEILDLSLDSMRAYKDGTQSLAYLDSSIHLAYSLLRMLEKWGKKGGGGEVYVRKKLKKKSRRKRTTEGMEVPDVEEEDSQEPDEEVIHETMFTFDAFEQRFANYDVTQTLLTYLSRYKEFNSPESMKRVVNLLHRQAVKAKAEGLFFNVSTLYLFKTILSEEKSFPRDQVHKDLIALINFILRKFFKAVAEDSFVTVQAFYPKNRGHWKELSSWEPEAKGPKGERSVVDTRFPPDVQVKKGYTWSQQLGIAIACLVDGKRELVEWAKQILMMVIGIRQRIIEDTDGSSSQTGKQDDAIEIDVDEDEVRAKLSQSGPSSEAMSKFTDYLIPYVNDEQAEGACKNPHLKLMFRLVEFFVLDEDAEELEWYVPAAILPSSMQRSLNVINQFLETPIDLNGDKPQSLLQKKRRRRTRRRRTRRRRSTSNSGDENDSEPDEPQRKKEKKKKEEQKYKSAQFIEDSDTDEVSMQAFLEREKALRERMALAAVSTGKLASMKATGTKKRRKNAGGQKKRKRGVDADEDSEAAPHASDASDDEVRFDILGLSKERSPADGSEEQPAPQPPRPRPKPRPLARKNQGPEPASQNPPASNPKPSSSPPAKSEGGFSDEDDIPIQLERPAKRKVLVISDDED